MNTASPRSVNLYVTISRPVHASDKALLLHLVEPAGTHPRRETGIVSENPDLDLTRDVSRRPRGRSIHALRVPKVLPIGTTEQTLHDPYGKE